MRFRACLEKDALLHLLGAATSMGKVGDTAILYLTEESIRISLITNNVDSIRCFCEFQSSIIFSDYRINSNNSNIILLQFNLDHFCKALISGKQSLVSLLKLVKRNDLPYLCFESKASGGLSIDIIHDIPIQLMKTTEIIYYLPPDIPPPKVALKLNKCKIMKNIIDRMNKIAKSVQIHAQQIGQLTFRVEGDCCINTYMNGLEPVFENTTLDMDTDSNNSIMIKIDNKKLGILLNTSQLHTHPSILYFTKGSALMLYISLIPTGGAGGGVGGSLTFYAPILSLNNDDDDDDDDGEQDNNNNNNNNIYNSNNNHVDNEEEEKNTGYNNNTNNNNNDDDDDDAE